jgi:hypothetical protein
MRSPRHPRRLTHALLVASSVGSLIGGSLIGGSLIGGSLIGGSVWAVSQAAASPTAAGPALSPQAKGVVKGICTGQTSAVGGLAITCGGQNGSLVGFSAFVASPSGANPETVDVTVFHITKTQDKASPIIAGYDAGTSSSTVYMAVKGQGANPNASVALSADRESSSPSVSELTATAVQSSGPDLVVTIQADIGGGATG